MTSHSRFLVVLCATGFFAMSIKPAEGQTTIRACANPAGQLRLIGAADSCRTQETLVTWNSAGAEGVTGGSDHSVPANGPAPLSATPVVLTDENTATGFPAYMIWANVSLQYNSGNPAFGTAPSPPGAGCSINYTVDGRAGSFVADARGVTFPIFAFGQNDRVVQLVVALTGMVGKDLSPPLAPTETVQVSLTCSTPGFVPPPAGPAPIPVKATSWTLTGIGVSKGFQ